MVRIFMIGLVFYSNCCFFVLRIFFGKVRGGGRGVVGSSFDIVYLDSFLGFVGVELIFLSV